MEEIENSKLRKTNRTLVLKPMDGKGPLDNRGLVDNRLFTGKNNLRVRKNPQTNIWYMEYDSGVLPPDLKGSFTSFEKARVHAELYFKKRNIAITEVID